VCVASLSLYYGGDMLYMGSVLIMYWRVFRSWVRVCKRGVSGGMHGVCGRDWYLGVCRFLKHMLELMVHMSYL
jgi:hypothetical protein